MFLKKQIIRFLKDTRLPLTTEQRSLILSRLKDEPDHSLFDPRRLEALFKDLKEIEELFLEKVKDYIRPEDFLPVDLLGGDL
jgi:hypothetical protein